MKHFHITDEMMSKATTYMPLQSKQDIARQIADLCLVPMKTAEQNKPGEKILAMPYLRAEDTALKQVLLLRTLLGYYFDIEVEDTDNAQEQYDYYAGAHIFNQLERYKSTEYKASAFDILSDFKDFRKMVETEIYNIRANWNDPIGRFTSAIQLFSTPENIEAIKAELERTKKEG